MSRGRIRVLALVVGVSVLGVLHWTRNRALPPSAPSLSAVAPAGESAPVASHDVVPVSAAAPARIASSTPEALAKVGLLKQILASKNDNDPRLDTEFRNLSAAAKAAFVEQYRATAREALNDRGTLVLLVGRELSSEADADFLRSVLEEAPCLGMSNCNVADSGSQGEHGADSDPVSRAYPQWVALQMIERARESGADAQLSAHSRELIQRGLESLATSKNKDFDTRLITRAQQLLRGDSS